MFLAESMLSQRSFRLAKASFVRLTSSVRHFSALPPHEVVSMPALSPTMESGNLAKWLLKEGDAITAGDIICQIETDKAIVDYEAQDDSFLARILVPEGAEGVVVGQPMMVTVEDQDSIVAFKDFKVDASTIPAQEPKSREETPPKKEEVNIDPVTAAPVVPSDFLVTPQVPAKVIPGPVIPAPVKPMAPHSIASVAASISNVPTSFGTWDRGVQKSALSSR